MRLLLAFVCLLAVPAAAASLRPIATLNVSVVRLSDLFDDAGANAARILGPGPAPGARIVVEATQLAAIARQFGVDWRPVSAADRAVLERPGKPLSRDAVTNALQAALAGAGIAADSEVEATTLSLPLIPFDANPSPVVTQLDHDTATGAFTATLAVSGPDMATQYLRAVGKVHETASIMVPIRRLQPGEVLRADDLRNMRVRTASLRAAVARSPADAVGLTPRNPLVADQPMRLIDLARPHAVRKGDAVQMLLSGGGLSLVGQAIALDSAAPGERVRVLNPSSRAMLEGTVIGAGQIRVSPDSLPIQPAPGALAPSGSR